jgi:hypothetical protein
LEGDDTVKRLLWFLALAVLVSLSAPVLAGDSDSGNTPDAAPPDAPPDQPASPEEQEEARERGYMKIVTSETIIEGKVTDATGQPLEGINVLLFVGGLVKTTAVTDVMGDYQISYEIDYAKDESIVLWYAPGMPPWLPKAVVLRESSKAASNSLFSPCIPKIELKMAMKFDVSMVDAKTRTMQLAESNCLE